MARKILVEPDRLESASQKIDGLVADYDRQYERLFSQVAGMGAAWKGTDNRAFVEEIEKFRNDFNAMSEMMTEYSTFLKKSAREYRDTQNNIMNQSRRLYR